MPAELQEEPRTYTVLVVEDDVHTAELLSYTLSSAGFQVFTAASGPDALKKLEIVTVDLIVSDVMMPHMDGFALRERIVNDPILKDIPFVFLTAKGTSEDQIRGLSSGVDEYVTKPFDPQVLIARIHAVLRRRENYSRVSRLDPLTGLLNRQTLEREIERELARIKRYPAQGSLVFLDIDGFKQVNDVYGHAAGDRALVQLAEALTNDIRSVDLVGRYGGEEFVLYFPETPEAVGVRIVERMMAQFRNLTEGESNGPLTFSAGVVEAPRDGVEFGDLVARSDQAMYQAKRAGKAQVMPWRENMTTNVEHLKLPDAAT
ncbi:MAG: diguanylate cyclase [Candidatus Hydrogenedentes bacterium]|nr:diguanylate cyclase [Candidatus Hydrogenedentota bacterium]